jgi:hypothetical protein
MILPDKHIRKMVFDALQGLEVENIQIPVYDTRVAGGGNTEKSPHYILMTTQVSVKNDVHKCGYNWESSILLDVVTTYPATGNAGSRLLADDIAEAVLNRLEGLQMAQTTGLKIIHNRNYLENDLGFADSNLLTFRKLIRCEYELIEI